MKELDPTKVSNQSKAEGMESNSENLNSVGLSYTENSLLQRTRERINSVSRSFCFEKWLQVSLHLENGYGQSCCLSPLEKIPQESLSANPLALHNTFEKMDDRKKMKRGEQPTSCNHCWNLEAKSSHPSERVIKSSRWDHLDPYEIAKTETEQVQPRYVEVSFSNVCNLKCAYCSSLFSSAWSQENALYGRMPFRTEPEPSLYSGKNPYVQSFWKWWPSLIETLEVLRITGGEPLMSSDLWQLLEELKGRSRKNLGLIINSNLMVSSEKLEKLSQTLNFLVLSGDVKNVKIVTSLESDGAQAEYARFGLKVSRFWQNIDYLLTSCPDINISITSTVQVLAIPSYPSFLKKVLSRRSEFSKQRMPRLTVDPSLLHTPTFFSITEISPALKAQFRRSLEEFLIEFKSMLTGFEYLKHMNIIKVLEAQEVPIDSAGSSEAPANAFTEGARAKLTAYLREYDRRRSTDFNKAFPELSEYHYIKN